MRELVLLLSSFLLVPLSPLLAQTATLDYFLQQARINNPNLNDLALQQKINRIDSTRLYSIYGPQINSNTAASYAPVIRGWGYDPAITNYQSVQSVVSLSKQFIGNERLRNQEDYWGLQNQSLRTQETLQFRDLARSVTSQYIVTYGDLLQLRYHRDLADLLSQEKDILKQLTEQSVYRQTDFLAFLVTFQGELQTLNQLKLQYRADLLALNSLTGIHDSSYRELSEPDLYHGLRPEFDQTVFSNKWKIDSLSIQNLQQQTDLQYKPLVSAYADAGYNSSLIMAPYKNLGVSAGLTMTIPIFDGHQRRMDHQKLDLEEEKRKKYRAYQENQFSIETAQLEEQYKSISDLRTQAEEQLRYTKTLIDAQKQQLLTGDTRIADYILAIGNYLSARQTISQYQLNQWQIINQLNYWNDSNR